MRNDLSSFHSSFQHHKRRYQPGLSSRNLLHGMKDDGPTLISRFCLINVFHKYAPLTKSLQPCVLMASLFTASRKRFLRLKTILSTQSRINGPFSCHDEIVLATGCDLGNNGWIDYVMREWYPRLTCQRGNSRLCKQDEWSRPMVQSGFNWEYVV